MSMTERNVKVSAVIVAGGRGTRFGEPKQFVDVFGHPLLEYTVNRFVAVDEADEIIVVVPSDFVDAPQVEHIAKMDGRVRIVAGGKERSDSVWNGITASNGEILVIHDGARPLVSPKTIIDCIRTIKEGHLAATVAIPVRDTLKRKTRDGAVEGLIDRRNALQIQTPQCFRRDIIERAYRIARERGFSATDDSTLVEVTLGIKSRLVDGDPSNFKITYREDIEMFKNLSLSALRVGHGYDLHRLVEGRPFILGGVRFESVNFGPLGHSDGDALIHAIIDSLLSPCGLGDIGKLFPDTDPEYRDISSLTLLERTGELLRKSGCVILNIDATVLLQKPKIGPAVDAMRHKIAEALNISPAIISIKGKTGEGIGPVGRSEAVEVHAVSLIGKLNT